MKTTYEIIGICMAVFNELGSGFSEIVYKDALEYELRQRNIPFEREKEFSVNIKTPFFATDSLQISC